MDSPNPFMPDPPAMAANLQERFIRMPRPIFAAMDGALFDDLPGDLTRKGVFCRSLFLGADRETELNGPWLVSITNDEVEAYLAKLASEQPCAVFWSCPEGERALWHHLRTINEILIPKSASSNPGGADPYNNTSDSIRVTFRHWDPNVLANTIPALTPIQLSRLFGPAKEIVLNSHDHGGRKSATRTDDLPEPSRGLLKLDELTIQLMERERQEVPARRRMLYLRYVAPDHTRDMSDGGLDEVHQNGRTEDQSVWCRRRR